MMARGLKARVDRLGRSRLAVGRLNIPPREIGTARVLSFELPTPPTINNAFFNREGGGRAKSAAYTRWQDTAVEMIDIQAAGKGRIGGAISVFIDLPAKMSGDLDNRIKPLIDALVKSGRIDDDRNVRFITAGRMRIDKNTRVCVMRFP